MSDYGFATYDDKNVKRRLGVVNSKWPIFGPKYADIGRCFKTIHITDTYTPDYKTASLNNPGDAGYTEYRWHEKQLIKQFEHKMGFRPVGYAFFSGNIILNVKCTITQTENRNGIASAGGYFTLNGNARQDMPVLPSMSKQMVPSYVSTGNGMGELQLDNYYFGITDYAGHSYATRSDIIVPDACLGTIKMDFVVANEWYGGAEYPYVVEIDDKYVKIYRNMYWLDHWSRNYISYNSSYREVNDRIKGASYYAGTELDCTVYLCPYRMEDLV